MPSFRVLLAAAVVAVAAVGCKTTAPVPKPSVGRPPEITPVGTWQSADRSARQLQMVFQPNGTLQFQGGMQFFNPASWDLDPMSRTLTLSFPHTPDDKLQVFKLYVGDGVLSLDRPGKTVTYRFDDATSSLNVAGWSFTKIDTSKPDIAPEPTLR